MRRTVLAGIVAVVALLAGVLGAVLAAVLAAGAADAGDPTWTPRGDTIVKVTGDPSNGYSIYHFDGSELFPPTSSEAAAECLEYDAYADRVRCRTQVRQWYLDLAAMKRAINWARYAERNQV